MKRFILICIVLLAATLRLYRLGEVPVGFHRDEAFLGYNAYSILKTGKDMTGNAFPLHLESFLYSPAGYSYAAIPSIKLFGLSPFSIRLPAAIAGILTVLVLSRFSILAALLLAISPWHINVSRTATENTIVVFLLTVALHFFLVYLRHKRFAVFLVSIVLFSSTYLFYQAPRAFVPLIVPLLLVYGWKHIPNKYRLRVCILSFTLVFVPVILIMSSPNLSVRIRTVSVFSSQETQLKLDEALRENAIAQVPPLIARALHNKLIAYAEVIANNYFQHFSYNFLLTDKGLPDRYRVPGMGLLYPWELLFAVVGAVVLLMKNRRLVLLYLGWIALAPVGSALTSDDVPNLQRTLLIFPMLSLVTAYGIGQLRNKLLQIVLCSVALFGLLSYLHAYYIRQFYHRPWYRHEGYERLVTEVNQLLPEFSKAVITNHESSPTIFFLFYNRINPQTVQDIWRKDKTADINTLSFGNYEFSKETCPAMNATPNILYVDFAECKIKPGTRVISRIIRNDGSEVFRLIDIRP